MRTNVVIDNNLMKKALKAGGTLTKRATIEEGLRVLVQMKGQRELLKLRGRIHWNGNLDAMRKD
ncbi:MAG: type II toxin-antitoxin system VapB family antitoxin [Fibrobacteres bacterium]|nr:type II toxin-antitoxin system VapB family antitoxin [Fibrobacterota bacterium]